MKTKPILLTCNTCRGTGEYKSGLYLVECPACQGDGRMLAGKVALQAEREAATTLPRPRGQVDFGHYAS